MAGEKKGYLSGYGVALDLKKTDYLAVDDRGRRTDAGGKIGLCLWKPRVTNQCYVDFTEDAYEDNVEDEGDLITSLLSQYPPNENMDVSQPLTEDELNGTLSKAPFLCHRLLITFNKI